MATTKGKRSKVQAPLMVPSEHRAAHVAGLLIDGRIFRLCFWTHEQWRALPAGEYVRMNISSLSGFGMVSVDPIDNDEWPNTLMESKGQGPIYPQNRLLNDISWRHGNDVAVELLSVVTSYGATRSLDLLKSHLADKQADVEYWQKAFDLDADRKERERKEYPAGFRVTEEDCEQYFVARRGVTIDDVIAEEVEAINASPGEWFHDRAIWQSNTLLAVISHGPDGGPLVTRFDQESSAFELDEIPGVELPSPGVQICNAPPEVKSKAKKSKAEPKPRGKRPARSTRN